HLHRPAHPRRDRPHDWGQAMNAVLARLIRVFTFRWPSSDGTIAGPGTAVRSRRSARRTIAWFVATVIVLNAVVLVATDALWPRLRDPEYGRRADRLKARIAENPGRPLILALGSSRVGAGVKPTEWEAVRPGRPDDPLLFNMAEVGSGPLIQLLTLHRVYAEGVRPEIVLIEYWPPFMAYDEWPEWPRVDWERLY